MEGTKPNCHLCSTPMALRHRTSDKKPFWGCANYPDCTGIQSMSGKQSAGSKPVRKNQKQREQHNREVSRRLAESAVTDDGTECPFDDVPGPNNTYTAFGRTGSALRVVEHPDVGEVDAEFLEIVSEF